MELNATEKLLKKNFGITSFKEVIQKLEKEGELTFKENLFVEKSFFIEKIKKLDASINELSSAYSMALEMAKSGSIYESFAKEGKGSLKIEYMKQRKLMVHHLSFFYKVRS
jgi:hypothetical protein